MQDSSQNAKEGLQGAINQISRGDFPTLLKEINDPPSRLFVRGNVELLGQKFERKMLCVVGSRKASQYGVDVCKELIRGLRGSEVVIVSGLALGIDGVAHRAALDANLPTIAVLGCGLGWDVMYPRAHVELAKEILAAGGALVSEMPEHWQPHPHDFPLRNRIMIGLSHAVLVVEASMKSGTLITARLATDYNRDVFAVPGSIFAKQTEGPHMLLSYGAMLVTKSEDILNGLGLKAELELETETGGVLNLSKTNNHLNDNHSHLEKSSQKLVSKKRSSRTLENCTEIERKILRALATEPMPRANLLQKIGGDTSEVNVALSLLEMKKFVVDSGGVFRVI